MSEAGWCLAWGGLVDSRKAMPMTRRRVLLLATLCVAAATAAAEAPDPAVAQVQTLTAALLKSMRAGRSLSPAERFRSLEPVIGRTFALPLMTRVAAGPDWERFTPEQQKSAIAAFSRFTVANYAFNFKDYNNQSFDVDSNVSSRGQDKLVNSRITSTKGDSTSLVYRMRQVDGTWKVLDVYSDGVSALTLRRTDFAAAIAAGGPPELISYLQQASDRLMKQ
jgi:phospholipid transport system substrate-binding protein